MKSITALSTLLICATAGASELHPIVAVEFGYFFGAFERRKIAMVKYGDFYLPSDFGGYQWIHGSKGFRRGGAQAVSQRTEREFNRWIANF